MYLDDQIINKKIIPLEQLKLAEFADQGIEVDILRLDTIHPVISGNKWFKLKNYLYDASQKNCKQLITFGGAYSNHIVATAYAASQAGFGSVGIIRGEQPRYLSHTLLEARKYGMHLHFISRSDYKRKDNAAFLKNLGEKFPASYIIPEGGAGVLGIKGCEEILSQIEKDQYSHILCAIGSGTMFIGIANSSKPDQYIIGIPVLKGVHDLMMQFKPQLHDQRKLNYCSIQYGYHFGGYAKKNNELIGFMNSIYERSCIPTDFVYTAKLFYGAIDLAVKKYFSTGNKLLLIHSGGLQGNLSLPPGTLNF